jgi:hypothetical protein
VILSKHLLEVTSPTPDSILAVCGVALAARYGDNLRVVELIVAVWRRPILCVRLPGTSVESMDRQGDASLHVPGEGYASPLILSYGSCVGGRPYVCSTVYMSGSERSFPMSSPSRRSDQLELKRISHLTPELLSSFQFDRSSGRERPAGLR